MLNWLAPYMNGLLPYTENSTTNSTVLQCSKNSKKIPKYIIDAEEIPNDLK